MTPPSELDRLAERVEAATGADPELDVLIGFQFADREKLWALSGMNAQRPLFTDDDLWQQVRRAPSEYGLGHRYTSSLDAAMTLAGDNAVWLLERACEDVKLFLMVREALPSSAEQKGMVARFLTARCLREAASKARADGGGNG